MLRWQIPGLNYADLAHPLNPWRVSSVNSYVASKMFNLLYHEYILNFSPALSLCETDFDGCKIGLLFSYVESLFSSKRPNSPGQ